MGMLANIIMSPSGAPDDGFILNTCMGALFVQSTLIFLETHSKRSYTICIILVIVGELESKRKRRQIQFLNYLDDHKSHGKQLKKRRHKKFKPYKYSMGEEDED